MKTVKPRFVKAHGLGHNASMAASYQVRCPFCRKSNLAWQSEMHDGCDKTINKCHHFEGVSKGCFLFRKAPVIRVTPEGVKINGVLFKESLVSVHNRFVNAEESESYDARLSELCIYTHSRDFGTSTNGRFRAIYAALQRRRKAFEARKAADKLSFPELVALARDEWVSAVRNRETDQGFSMWYRAKTMAKSSHAK